MQDVHIHLEKGPYTKEWLNTFIETALTRNISEIWVLEHTHRFNEFLPIYQEMRELHPLQDQWIQNKQTQPLSNYTQFIKEMRALSFPIKINFGLEVCYFPQHESLIKQLISSFDFDFIVGSIHYIDNKAYDLKGISETVLWDAYETDFIYKRYFELMKQCIQSNLFDGLAHPDTIKMFNRYPSYDLTSTYQEIADCLNQHSMYTENNVGCYYRYHHSDKGLSDLCLSIFKAKKVDIKLATDSHTPDTVGIYLNEIADKTYQ